MNHRTTATFERSGCVMVAIASISILNLLLSSVLWLKMAQIEFRICVRNPESYLSYLPKEEPPQPTAVAAAPSDDKDTAILLKKTALEETTTVLECNDSSQKSRRAGLSQKRS